MMLDQPLPLALVARERPPQGSLRPDLSLLPGVGKPFDRMRVRQIVARGFDKTTDEITARDEKADEARGEKDRRADDDANPDSGEQGCHMEKFKALTS